MAVDRKRKWIIWLGWSVIFPLGLWYSYHTSPLPSDFNVTDFIIFVLLMIPVALLPIVVNNTPISFTQWISLMVFLQFGLFAELLLTQIFVIIVMFRLHRSKDQSYRYALNSIMFIFISIASASIFYLFGGTHDPESLLTNSFILLAFIYIFSYYLINQALYSFFFPIIFKVKKKFIGQELLWETLSLLVVFPIGMILYILYHSMGISSALLVGIPVICMLLLLHNYNTTIQMNNHLQKAVEFGHLLTQRLKFEEVIEVFIENLLKMFPIDYLYILDVVDGDRLELIRSYEKGKFVDIESEPLRKNEGISGYVWAVGKGLLFHEKKEWKHIVKGYFPSDIESIITVPMIKNNEVTGVILLGSDRKRMYDKFELMILEILCSYLAISLDNARHYEQTKIESERCPLTTLFNARYFNKKLEENCELMKERQIESLSLMLIDIDHFKMVNDTYGHQSGNEILCQLAEILKSLIANKGVLARYGGEEFAVILPNYKKEEAISLAEDIRKTIEEWTFVMYDDLAEVRRKLSAHITVSIGVAAAPDDTDDPLSLLRYADRALYIGAKRVGRNKVAKYVSL